MKLKATLLLIALLVLPQRAGANILVTRSSFPVYDMTREIAGDFADVKLLLRPGTEPHEFEPSALDVKALNDADVFIFTGPELEHWAGRIADSLTDTLTINASRNITLVDNDPHIWLDMNLASHMAANILTGLISADKLHSEIFTDNARKLITKLAELDGEFMSLPRNRALVFAGEFSYSYFLRRYGLDYISAYDGENEPGVRKLAEVIRYIRDNNVKHVFSDAVISQATHNIAAQTGAEILTFNTAHNCGENDSFIEIMTQNLANIRTAIND